MTDDTRHVTTPATLTCAHCGRAFTHAGRPGPAPRYCRRSCRQRAYETRAAATTTVAVTHDLDAGLSPSGRVHALDPARPDPRADGTRTTLCGTKARPSKRTFAPSSHSCARCARAVASRTITDHVPARDLVALLAAAREAGAALDRSYDKLALRLAHATINVTRHLTRDKPPPPIKQPDT